MSEISVARDSTVVQAVLSGVSSLKTVRAVLIILLCASFLVILLGAFHADVNGDEYIFLSNIHRAANGWQMGVLQTAYVHLFSWLPYVGQDELVQTKIGRVIHIGSWACSLALLHRLGLRFLDPLGALAGVVLFALFSFSIVNATNFRIEGFLLPVLLSVALLLLKPTTSRVAAAGAMSGLALALTIKAVLWAPAFIGVLAIGLWENENRLRPILAGTIAGTATFAGIMLAHSWAVSTDTGAGLGTSVGGLASVGAYMFFDGFFPMWHFLWSALVQNPPTWLLITIGLGLALAGLRAPESRRESLILLFLASPILSVAFYTNSFPYAYLVLMPGACLLAGKAFSRFMGTDESLRVVTALLCLGGAAVPMIYFSGEWRQDQTQHQGRVLSIVHQLFPDPVPYFDVSGKVASFPRKGPEITRAVLTPYRRAGVSVIANEIRESHPPLLIANSTSLNVWAEDDLESLDPDIRLLPQDEGALRAAYAHYWDQIYLAGRQWSNIGAGERREFEIVVPGDHTLLAENAVTVDGQIYSPGATIALEAGPHELRTTAAEPDMRILWGKDLKLPLEDGQL